MERDWVTLFRDVRGSRFVGLIALVGAEGRERATTLGIIRIPYDAAPNGLPKQGELKRAGDIEDAVVEVLEARGAIYIGRLSGAGCMTAYFYAPSGLLPDAVSVRVKSWLGKRERRLEVETRLDPMWTFYESELMPTPAECEADHSRPLLEKLREHGDKHEVPRAVDFTFIFPTGEGRADFLARMAARNIFLNREGAWENFDGEGWPYWCSVEFTTSIDSVTIGSVCADFRALARSCGGDMDGWACHVENGRSKNAV